MVTVVFNPGDTSASKYSALSQYDYGQVLRIQGLNLPAAVEIDFALQPTGGTSVPRIGITKDGVTDVIIPDSMLENNDGTKDYSIYAFVFLTDATSGQTEYRITLGVTARPKPEAPGGTDNPDIFHEAVQAVREAAEQAAESEKQAEGWAHGREDLPERAEDNARYYAGQAQEDSWKTAEDRKEIERLVESVSGIDEQVAKVEELSKNAQEAATRAETSAEQGETHKQAAENASTAAQAAAGKTAEDRAAVQKTKEVVEELSTQVQENKDSVDKTAQEFTLAAQQALADVNNAGQTQTDRVQTAGETAVRDIQTTQRTATGAVETAKTEAVKTVQTEGATQTGKVTAEGEKQVQAVQAAAQEIIADREQIQTNKTDIADLRQSKAGAIVETAKGSMVQAADSAEAFMEGLKLFGKSEQITTTGAQLFDAKTVLASQIQKGIVSVDSEGRLVLNGKFDANNRSFKITLLPGTYTLSSDNRLLWHILSGSDNAFDMKLTVDTETEYDCYIASGTYNNLVTTPMINAGATAKPFEPYTGGKPSPSPDYPQEIISNGKDGRIECTVSGKNILPPIPKKVRKMFLKAGTTLTLMTKNGIESLGGNVKLIRKNGTIMWFAIDSGQTRSTLKIDSDAVRIENALNKGAEHGVFIGDVPLEQYESYAEQSLAIQTPNGLPGIPVSSGGNYTDKSGQQWICDEIDLERGKYVQRVKEFVIYHNSPLKFDLDKYGSLEKITILGRLIDRSVKKYGAILCRELPSIKNWYNEIESICASENAVDFRFSRERLGLGAETTPEENKEAALKFLETNPLHYLVELNDAIEIDLPPETIEAYKALHTYYPTTVVSNNANADMQLDYVADTKLYIDKKIKEHVTENIQKTANLLSLMPLSTQAAMIENDTNNILDNMEVEK